MTAGKASIWVMARTASDKVPAAAPRASAKGASAPETSTMRSFSKQITARQCRPSRARHSSASSRFFDPSAAKGKVTRPMTNAPAFLACSATTGAAPEPVPPPSPAQRMTTSAPPHSARNSVRLSLAEARPRAASPPAPRPLATSRPIWILRGAGEADTALASVCTATRSAGAPSSRARRCSMARPAWPRPITLTADIAATGAAMR